MIFLLAVLSENSVEAVGEDSLLLAPKMVFALILCFDLSVYSDPCLASDFLNKTKNLSLDDDNSKESSGLHNVLGDEANVRYDKWLVFLKENYIKSETAGFFPHQFCNVSQWRCVVCGS